MNDFSNRFNYRRWSAVLALVTVTGLLFLTASLSASPTASAAEAPVGPGTAQTYDVLSGQTVTIAYDDAAGRAPTTGGGRAFHNSDYLSGPDDLASTGANPWLPSLCVGGALLLVLGGLLIAAVRRRRSSDTPRTK